MPHQPIFPLWFFVFLLVDEDRSSAGSPRRQRAPSIPRNGEELASYLIHGSLRFTPSRQQILSYSGIRLEERASALKKEEAEAAAVAAAAGGRDFVQQAMPSSGNERGRLHSSSDSMLLLNDRKLENRFPRRKTRGRSSEPALGGMGSDREYKSALSSASEKVEVEEEEKVVIRPKKRKRARELEDTAGGETKRKKFKKRRRERHKEEDHEDDIPVFAEATSSTNLASLRSRRHNKETPPTRTISRPKPKSGRLPVAPKKDVVGKRKRKVREEYEGEDEDEDYDGEQGVDDERDLSFTIGRPMSRTRKKKVPASPARAKGSQKRQQFHQTRQRLKSSDTMTTESEVESSRPDVNHRVNGSSDKPRKSNRLSALRSSSIDESDFGAVVVGLRRGGRHRSQSSSVYETAGEADFSEAENKRKTLQKKKRKPPLSCFSDSENRDVFSEGVATPPSATSTKDLTFHVNDAKSNNSSSRWDQQEQKKRSHKRKRSPNADADRPNAAKKPRTNSDGSEGGRVSKGGMLNGLVVNGEKGSTGDEIRPMELVWAKCRGYPPYPALVSVCRWII